MSLDEGAELRHAFTTFQAGPGAGHTHSAGALERVLLSTSADGVEADRDTIAAAVRLLRPADDNGTARLEVRDQAMTHRRWFEVSADGALSWGER